MNAAEILDSLKAALETMNETIGAVEGKAEKAKVAEGIAAILHAVAGKITAA